MRDLVNQALDRTVQSVKSGSIVSFKLPYIWAFGLCAAGLRVEYMKRLTDNLSVNRRRILTVLDGEEGALLFVTVPKGWTLN